jgi:hypothetical protein
MHAGPALELVVDCVTEAHDEERAAAWNGNSVAISDASAVCATGVGVSVAWRPLLVDARAGAPVKVVASRARALANWSGATCSEILAQKVSSVL